MHPQTSSQEQTGLLQSSWAEGVVEGIADSEESGVIVGFGGLQEAAPRQHARTEKKSVFINIKSPFRTRYF